MLDRALILGRGEVVLQAVEPMAPQLFDLTGIVGEPVKFFVFVDHIKDGFGLPVEAQIARQVLPQVWRDDFLRQVTQSPVGRAKLLGVD